MAVMAPIVMWFNSLTVIFVPLAVTVPKLFVLLFRVTLPAVPVPEFIRFAVPVTVAEPVWVIAPPAVTFRFVAEIVPRIKVSVSFTLIFVPLARKVPKLFVALIRVILPAVPVPDETKFAVPLTLRFVPAL